jgi:YesN/AraC family two-component response regulator
MHALSRQSFAVQGAALMPESILLIDDDKEFREELATSLEEYTVIAAASGEEAVELLRKPNEIDLAIIDVVMPGLSGIDVMKEIQKLSPGLGIIILTGHSSKDVAIEALKAHADDYIEKPPDIDKMKDVIERLLEIRREKLDPGLGNSRSIIEKTMRYAKRNCYKKTFLKDAAAAIYLSPKYLSRLFKQSTGTRFSDFRLELKMKEAKELLEKSDFNVNQIAYKLGYQNAESFIRIFKKITSQTPTEYRKKIKQLRAEEKQLVFC